METMYKETEIGLIPEDWEVKKIGDICNIRRGASPRPIHDYIVPKGIPWIKIADATAQNSRYIEWTKEFIKEEGRQKTVIVKPGDLILSNSATPGLPKFLKIDAAIHDGWLFLDPKIHSNKNFIYYMLLNERPKLTGIADGSVFRNLKTDIVKNHKIALPNSAIQEKIANNLVALDNKIELNHNMNLTLEKIGQTLFRHWFVHFEFPNSEGHPYKSSGGEMVDSELGDIPMGWEVQELGTVIETTGGGTPSTKKEEYWENGNIKWYSPRDITRNNQMFITNSEKNINNSGLKNSSAKLFPPFSLMMTSRATVGELSINTKEACTNQGFITCIPNEKLSMYYLYFWIKMNKEYIISLASGSTFREINKSTFRGLNIIIPSNEVLSKYNSLLKPIFNQIETLQAQNKELTEIRDSILPKLMSGKIRLNIAEEATAK